MTAATTKSRKATAQASPLYKTKRGRLYVGACEDVLTSSALKRQRGKVNLLLTSPPFVLNRKKKYGNLEGSEYVDWIGSLGPIFADMLSEDGSIVIELGNAWEPGQPTMSTLAIKALLAFQEAGELHLCQEFICYNPARLPTPAQWVNVERSRVKDAFTRVWWLSRNPKPKANNRNVLTPYSDSMKKLLERGTYNAGTRPSEHAIGERSFLTNNGGSIPPNVLFPSADELLDAFAAQMSEEVLAIPNTMNSDPYQKYCRDHGITAHPARMQHKLVQFFVDLLTEKGDLVVDPFGGSNTTGWVAENSGRRWVAIEKNIEYAAASQYRFSSSPQAKAK